MADPWRHAEPPRARRPPPLSPGRAEPVAVHRRDLGADPGRRRPHVDARDRRRPLGHAGRRPGLLYTWSLVAGRHQRVRTGDHTDRSPAGLRDRHGAVHHIGGAVLLRLLLGVFLGRAVSPDDVAGFSWPPEGIEPVAPWDIPFLNTMILLLSGCTVTWAHHCVREGDNRTATKALALTVLLGLTFTSFQAYEYCARSPEASRSTAGSSARPSTWRPASTAST